MTEDLASDESVICCKSNDCESEAAVALSTSYENSDILIVESGAGIIVFI